MATVQGTSGKTFTDNGNGTTTITYANADQARANGATQDASGAWTRTVANTDSNFSNAYKADTTPASASTSTSSATSTPSTTSYNGGTTVPYYTNSDGSRYYETTRADGTTYKTGAYGDNQVYQDWASDQWAQKRQEYADIMTAKRAGQDTTAMENAYNKKWENADIGVNGFVQNAYNTYNNANDLNNYLASAGMSDFDTNNATLTAGRDIIPGGSAKQYQSTHVGADGSNSANSLWLTYGGRDYLIGGDSANFAQYANGKVDNLVYLPDGQTNIYGGTVALDANGNAIHQNNYDNRDYLLGNLLNNPYIQNDPNLYGAVRQNMTNYDYGTGTNMNAGTGMPNNETATPGYYTGNVNVDSTINNINNMLDYSVQTGNSDLYNSIVQLLTNGLDTTKEWLAGQKDQANKNAESQARAARVNQLLQQQALNEAYSAAGIGTTGAVQSGMQSINNSYNGALNDINSNLATLLGNLDEQELKALGDYYSNLAQYNYNITNDDLDRQYKYAALAQDQAQFNANQQLQQQELAQRQAQQELENQWYEREYADKLLQQADAQAQKNATTENTAQKNAIAALQAGYTTPELAQIMGIPYDQAVALAQQYANKKTYVKQ